MNDSIYTDIMCACNEVIDYQNGNIKLKTDIVEISDATALSRFSQLDDREKSFVVALIDQLLASNTR